MSVRGSWHLCVRALDNIFLSGVYTGRAYFETCPDGSIPQLSGCPFSTIQIVEGMNALLDVRVTFLDGGSCQNQSIRSLSVTHNGVLIYVCSNLQGSFNSECSPSADGKYILDTSQCSFSDDCDSVGSELQCCKFRGFLVITNFNASDAGNYTAAVSVQEDGSRRRTMIKTMLYGMLLYFQLHTFRQFSFYG